MGIKCAVKSACFWMPAPPQIICQFIQSINARGHDGEDRHATIHFHELDFLSSHISLFSISFYERKEQGYVWIEKAAERANAEHSPVLPLFQSKLNGC